MTCHVVVPGIFGTEMIDSQSRTIWPPGQTTQAISSTELVNLLGSETTRPGRIIRRAVCVGDVYGSLLDHVGQRPGSVLAFGYDWRIDVRAAAATLAASLSDIAADQPIVLIAHSMGGLVTRWLLESGDFAGASWFGRIKLAVFICTPHLGAPLALFRLLGKDGIPVILPDWAMQALAANPDRYPAGYQLLPAPDIDCVSRPGQTALDVYHAFPGLKPVGTAAATAVYALLDRFAKPASVTYCAAFGRGQHVTVGGIMLNGMAATEGNTDGDGTVPTWSGDPTGLVAAATDAFSDIRPFVEDHVGILHNARFLTQLDAWLDAPAVDAAEPVVAMLSPTPFRAAAAAVG